jgi:hypothetical protein
VLDYSELGFYAELGWFDLIHARTESPPFQSIPSGPSRAAAEVIKYAKVKICQSVSGEWSDFLFDHLAFCPINIMILWTSSFTGHQFRRCEMPAQEPSGRQPSIEPSSTHTWLSLEGRHLEIEAGKPLLHQFCTKCRRNFVRDLSSGKWHAVFPRIFDFEHLDQVSEEWLKETCPRQYLTSDVAAARQLSRGRTNNSEGSSGSEENG